MITQIALGLVLMMFMSMTNLTLPDCPENYYGNGSTYDLLDRGWCDSDNVFEP